MPREADGPVDRLQAQAAPTHPGAQPEPLGSLPWPQALASGRPKVEDFPLSTTRWRNMPGCEAAAQWARHGEGGSGLSPLFTEASTEARPGGSGPGVALAAAFVAGAVLGVAAARRVL